MPARRPTPSRPAGFQPRSAARPVAALLALFALCGLAACQTLERLDRPSLAALISGERINPDLWRAAVEVTGFVPGTANDDEGAIATDWYVAPGTPAERLRLRVQIGGPELKRSYVRVVVVRHVRGADGQWMDAPPAPDTSLSLEDMIYQRARALRARR